MKKIFLLMGVLCMIATASGCRNHNDADKHATPAKTESQASGQTKPIIEDNTDDAQSSQAQ